jgi:hypothetical protein
MGPCPGTNISAPSASTAERAKPAEAVSIGDEQELIGEVELAQIDNAILRYENDAVAARMRTADVENLDLLPSLIQRQSIPERLLRQPGELFLGRHLLPLHQRQKVRAIVLVPDLQHVGVGDIAF